MGKFNVDFVKEITEKLHTESFPKLVDKYIAEAIDEAIIEREEFYGSEGWSPELAEAKALSERSDLAGSIDFDQIKSAAERDAYNAAVDAAEKEVEDLEDQLAYEAERAS